MVCSQTGGCYVRRAAVAIAVCMLAASCGKDAATNPGSVPPGARVAPAGDHEMRLRLAAAGRESGVTLQLSSDLLPVESGGKWGFLAPWDGVLRIDPRFLCVSSFSEGFAAVKAPATSRGGTVVPLLWGFVDKGGGWLAEPQFDWADDFVNGFARVRKSDRMSAGGAAESSTLVGGWNFLDRSGRLLSAKDFDWAEPFSEGYAAVFVDNAWGYLNGKGALEIPPRFEDAGDFRRRYARVKSNGSWGFINDLGVFIIPARFDDAGDFSEGLAAVRVGSSFGYVDVTGRTAIEPQFGRAGEFRDGLARVRMGARWWLVDTAGVPVEPQGFSAAFDMKNALAGVATGEPSLTVDESGRTAGGIRWGFVGTDGALAIAMQYDAVRDFSEGLAAVQRNGRWGYIDPWGAVIVEFAFDEAFDFHEGLALVRVGGERRWIDADGKAVWPRPR